MITVTQEKAEKNEETVKLSLIFFRVDLSIVSQCTFKRKKIEWQNWLALFVSVPKKGLT